LDPQLQELSHGHGIELAVQRRQGFCDGHERRSESLPAA